jgi:hypothetical protein
MNISEARHNTSSITLYLYVGIEMGDARWRSGIPDGSISMETKSNRILPRLVIEHKEYRTNRPSPTDLQ